MGAIPSDWAPFLLNLGDVGSSYGLRSLGFVVAMSFCGLYDIFVMIGVRVVSIWYNSMLLPSFLEGIVLAQECSSSVCGFRDDKVGVGDLDTSVRYINSDVERWLIVAKNKDEEDDDNEEEDDDEDDKGEEGPEDEDEGEEGLEGEGNDEDDEDDEDDDDDEGNGGEEDDQDDDRDDEENGKEGDEDGEEEDGVEDEGNEGEDDDEDNGEEDEDEEPPKKRRK